MTVDQLIARFRELGCTGKEEVRVAAYGGFRMGKEIDGVTMGFDWDSGAVILHPKLALTVYKPLANPKVRVEATDRTVDSSLSDKVTEALRPASEPAKPSR